MLCSLNARTAPTSNRNTSIPSRAGGAEDALLLPVGFVLFGVSCAVFPSLLGLFCVFKKDSSV